MRRYDWKRGQALCIAVTACTLLQVGCDYKTTGGGSPASAPANSVSLAARAESGDKAAMRALARAYGLGTDGQKKDELLAFKWYLKLAEGGDATAMAEVARRYREGNGVRSDFDESLRWADKGAELGDADALYLSAIRIPFDFGFGWQVNLDVDSQEKKLIVDSAAELNRLTRAAEAGNSEAKFRLGRLLRTGVWYTIRGPDSKRS
jgi:TPR repeat protein